MISKGISLVALTTIASLVTPGASAAEPRDDGVLEDFEGHKLDRAMLDLLIKYK